MTDAANVPSALLLDIEGTITPISFVHEVLFPFAREHVIEYLVQNSTAPEVQQDIAALYREHTLDERVEQTGETGEGSWSMEEIVAYVNWLIECDRKSPALKSLQGKIWEQGYREGVLKAPLFDDLVPSLIRLRAKRFRIAIFSSGSILAQKLLIGHTETGDHTDLIDEYFDTSVGGKMSSASYSEIARRLDLLPERITFVSDVTSELNAALEAGMSTLLCVRPGNPPQTDLEKFSVIRNFSEILPAQK